MVFSRSPSKSKWALSKWGLNFTCLQVATIAYNWSRFATRVSLTFVVQKAIKMRTIAAKFQSVPLSPHLSPHLDFHEDLPPGLKISSEIEHFKRDWTFQARLVSRFPETSEIEKKMHSRSTAWEKKHSPPTPQKNHSRLKLSFLVWNFHSRLKISTLGLFFQRPERGPKRKEQKKHSWLKIAFRIQSLIFQCCLSRLYFSIPWRR